MDVMTNWVDARFENPRDGELVLAAITGRYPVEEGEVPSSEQDFWLVLPMHFRTVHPVEGTGHVIRDCYWDADGVIRKPFGAGTEEQVTHWAALPPLPGLPVDELLGASVASALANATGTA